MTVNVNAQKKFEVTPEVRAIYASVLALDFEEARIELVKLSVEDPNNLMGIYLEDFIYFFSLFTTEDRNLYHQIEDEQASRLESLKEGPEDSPWFRFTRAEVYMHRALLRLKFDEYLSAAADINRAFRLLRKNEGDFPDFAPTYKTIGVLRMGVGTVPDKYQWAVKLFSSLEGTIQSGLEDLERSISLGKKQNSLVLRETQYLYAQAMVHFKNDPDKAWDYMKTLELDPAGNVLECLILSNLAMRTGRNDLAIGLLCSKPSGPDKYQIPYMDLMLGRALLFSRDAKSDVPLKTYVETFEGENFIKEAYQKLAWNALLNNDTLQYWRLMDSCLLRGRAVTGEDKNALKEARSRKIPNRELLEVRLLFDGSYLDLALSQLSYINKIDLDSEETLEYEYRKARILHGMDDKDGAIRHYGIAIQMGKDSDFYFACNAALQCGLIYEVMGNNDKAEEFFRECLSMHPDDYQASLHQKAKAGLSRIKSGEQGGG